MIRGIVAPKSLKNVAIVIKVTPYESYTQLKAQGMAPVALRWSRLEDRHNQHRRCVENVIDIVKKAGLNYSVFRRDEIHRGVLADKDLLITVGGDGTVLNVASFLDDNIPVCGVNSDPSKKERIIDNKQDERRSTGQLCAATASNVDQILPHILKGDYYSPASRTRIQTIVRSTMKTTRLPPALNDILIANPSPAAVSRFRLEKFNGTAQEHAFSPLKSPANEMEKSQFSFNVWSSGMWISTATGSTAAIKAAGGVIMDPSSTELQYQVREHLVEQGNFANLDLGDGFVNPDEMLHVRWNSQYGSVFVDGAHMRQDLELGDILSIDAHAPCLQIFEKPPG